MKLAKTYKLILEKITIQFISIFLVLIILGPSLATLADQLSHSYSISYAQVELTTEYEDIEIEENKSEKETEKEENKTLKEYTLQSNLELIFNGLGVNNPYPFYSKLFMCINANLYTPPPQYS
ncbi:hypothetical protein PZB74_17960 [Porifericola rhodea]|uniref:hypothetical protein n=1 Tax=Porifericola rhodea TaxID=930972 RepID=UPI002665F64D|nr:hypothetical protein [Porifericola rhodea]WKN30844.1 hypothetical protein PZB74_17960 [Porifericola rhodea]